MKHLLWLFFVAFAAVSCGGNKAAEPEPAPDTVVAVPADTAADSDTVALPEPPLAADGFFDDFAYNFMRSKKFQLSRITFPLKTIEYGKVKMIAKGAWKFDRLYSRADLYTVIFDSEKSMSTSPKDTALKHVAVEMLNMEKKNIKQYLFDKVRGAWLLTCVDVHNFEADENSDFLAFLHSFLSNPEFRSAHISRPFTLVVTDPDTFQPIRGEAEPDQWDIYAPELPTDRITNINYGQKYANSSRRVLLVSSTDGSMNSIITFKKTKKTWYAVKLDNN